MEKRNREAIECGNLINKRIGTFPLTQFSDLYTQKPAGTRTLEKITRDQATKTFDDNFDKRISVAPEEGWTLPSPAQIQIDKKRRRNEFLDKLGFKEGMAEVEVAPRDSHYYDSLLNSARLSPKQSATLLHDQ